ncbi:hypothetical protein ACPZ19_17815 [Amycolatopsis lurida]
MDGELVRTHRTPFRALYRTAYGSEGAKGTRSPSRGNAEPHRHDIATVQSSVTTPLLTVLLTLTGGWFVTARVTDRWDRVKKIRDLDLASAAEFQRLYGEFFAIWKLWNFVRDREGPEQPKPDSTWELLSRAAEMEGGIEALLTKVAAERELSDREVARLGALRQAFQRLREAIQCGEELPWHSSGTTEYSAFKSLSCFFSCLLSSTSTRKRKFPSAEVAAAAFREITHNRFEGRWTAYAIHDTFRGRRKVRNRR